MKISINIIINVKLPKMYKFSCCVLLRDTILAVHDVSPCVVVSKSSPFCHKMGKHFFQSFDSKQRFILPSKAIETRLLAC